MALGYLYNAEVPLDIAFRILGFELSDEDWKRIEEQVKRKEEQAEELTDKLIEGGNNGGGVAFQPEDPKDKPDPFQEKSVDNQQLQRELSIWQSKCLSALKRGETASSVSFVPVNIPLENYDRIVEGLLDADNAENVKQVFAHAFYNGEESQENGDNLSVADKMRSALREWKEIALKGDSVEFESEHIPPTLQAAIEGGLEEAKTEDDITQVFADIWMGYP